MKDGFYIIGSRSFWVLDEQEFNIDQARVYLAGIGFSRRDIQDYMKGLRLSPVKVDQ